MSHHKIRAKLLVSWQTFVAMGILLSASADFIFHGHWRQQIRIAFVPAVPLLCMCYVVPQSGILSVFLVPRPNILTVPPTG